MITARNGQVIHPQAQGAFLAGGLFQPRADCLRAVRGIRRAELQHRHRGTGFPRSARCRRAAFTVRFQALDNAVQLQFLQRGNALFQVRQLAVRKPEFHRRVPPDRRQLFGKPGLFRPGCQLLAQLSLDVSGVVQHVFQCAVFLQQLHRGLVADPGNPGNIVARVPGQALPVRHLRGGKPVFLINLFRGKADRLRNALPGKHQLRSAAHQLQRVPVAGQHQRRRAGIRALQAQRTQQVVRLPALQGIPADAHIVQQGMDRIKLLPKFRRRGRPPGLVFRVYRVAEGRSVLVEAYGGILHVLLADHLQQHAQEAVNRVGIYPVRVHQGQRVECPVHQAVSVHQQECIFHGILVLTAFFFTYYMKRPLFCPFFSKRGNHGILCSGYI